MAGGFSAQPGHILLRKQSVQGTYASDIATAGIGIKLRSGALGTDRELMVPDPEIGGGRDITDSYLGPVKWSGSYDFYARVESFLSLLYACLGVTAQVTTTGITTHTLTPSDGAALPYYSVEELIGAGLECFNYTDAVVNTLHLEAAADGYLMGTAGMIAAKQIAGATPTDMNTPTALFDNLPMIVGTNVSVTFNGVTLPAKSFNLDINNNFQDDDFRLGSLYLGSLIPKRREVTASVTIRQQDSALWRQAVYGTAAATAPGGIPTKQALVLNVSTYENIVAGTPLTPQQIAFTFPQAILKPYNFSPSGDDIIEPSIDIQAIRPVPATPIVTAVAKTGRATIA